jgi:hypothetical protein
MARSDPAPVGRSGSPGVGGAPPGAACQVKIIRAWWGFGCPDPDHPPTRMDGDYGPTTRPRASESSGLARGRVDGPAAHPRGRPA